MKLAKGHTRTVNRTHERGSAAESSEPMKKLAEVQTTFFNDVNAEARRRRAERFPGEDDFATFRENRENGDVLSFLWAHVAAVTPSYKAGREAPRGASVLLNIDYGSTRLEVAESASVVREAWMRWAERKRAAV